MQLTCPDTEPELTFQFLLHQSFQVFTLASLVRVLEDRQSHSRHIHENIVDLDFISLRAAISSQLSTATRNLAMAHSTHAKPFASLLDDRNVICSVIAIDRLAVTDLLLRR